MKAAFILLALAAPVVSTNYLFAGCTEQNSRIINCEGQSLAEVPEDIPDGFEKLRLAGNVIHDGSSGGTEGTLSAAQLTNIEMHPSINEIQLQQNGIDTIADNTFVGFPTLLVLRLFGNSIRTITANALNGLSSLTTLYINNNPNLASLQAGAFSAFASTLDELFAKECASLALVEDNSVNALTFRPLFVDMTDCASICMVSPFGALECSCAAGHVGNGDGYCEVSDAPTPAPTTALPTPAPTAAPATSEPTPAPTAAPTTSEPTPAPTDATTAAASTTGIVDEITATTEDQNRAQDTTAAQDRDNGWLGEGGSSKSGGKGGGGGFLLPEGGGKGGGKGGGGGFLFPEAGSSSTGGKGKHHKIGKMELGVSYQPWGDLKSNVHLDGISSATAVIVSSMFVVAAALATVQYRRATAKSASHAGDQLEAASPGDAETSKLMRHPPPPAKPGPYGTLDIAPTML